MPEFAKIIEESSGYRKVECPYCGDKQWGQGWWRSKHCRRCKKKFRILVRRKPKEG